MFLPSSLFEPREWAGDNPYFLAIILPDGQGQVIDLDERGWMTTHAALMRAEATWHLVEKAGLATPLMLVVLPGEQPYYTARTMGVIGSGGSNTVVAYGIGKKRLDGHVDRLWYLGGSVVLGDDVDVLGIRLVHALGPRT